MTDLIKKLIQWKLRLLAWAYLRLKNIEIVAITGSAGKTTTKITMGQILPENLIYVPKEAYNTEYGVPLALFREKVPANPKNLAAWAVVLLRMFGKLFLPSPFTRIVLEYGADKPGDISYLTSFTRPHIAVVTAVLPVHLEGFSDVAAIASEKSKLVSALSAKDFAVLNFDDRNVRAMAEKTVATIISFGEKDADIQYSNLKYNETGMTLDVEWKKNKYQMNIPVAAPQLLPSYLGAFAVGLLLGEEPKDLVKSFSHIKPELGRMNILRGINGSVIIDDSYNSNPESAKAALRVLANFPGRRVTVLGSMNELGDFAKQGHEEVGEVVAEIADEVLVVGETASKYLFPFVLDKMNKNVVHKFTNSDKAGEYLAKKVTKGDVILFKGSQNGVFTEEAIKYVLADPAQASDLLVRQGPMWQNKKGIK